MYKVLGPEHKEIKHYVVTDKLVAFMKKGNTIHSGKEQLWVICSWEGQPQWTGA